MKKTEPTKYIFILHGPNMNIVGLKPANRKNRITLNKINKCLQKKAQKIKRKLIILQTNNESTAVTALQRRRNKISGIIIFPGPWQQSGFVLQDTLEILQIPYITISSGEDITLLKGIDNIKGDIIKACETAIERLTQSI